MADVIQLPQARKAPRRPGIEPGPKFLYHPVEHVILRHYFGIAPLDPEATDLYEGGIREEDPDEEERPEDPSVSVWLQRGLEPETAIPNAVARICLNAVQGRLPQWGVCRADGSVVLGRNYEKRRVATIEPKPIFLFEINWADSGPGFSWPAAYHVTFLPGYGRWVVTSSVDSPDVWGCTELAIGHFPGHHKLLAACRKVIVSHWREEPGGDEDTGWAYLFNTGHVDARTAYRWRRSAWPGAPIPEDPCAFFDA